MRASVTAGDDDTTIEVPSNATDDAVRVIALELYANVEAPVKRIIPPGEKSINGNPTPNERGDVDTSGPVCTTTFAPFATVIDGVVNVAEPFVIEQFGIYAPPIKSGTLETVPVPEPVADVIEEKKTPEKNPPKTTRPEPTRVVLLACYFCALFSLSYLTYIMTQLRVSHILPPEMNG